jgi:hypothetical protein
MAERVRFHYGEMGSKATRKENSNANLIMKEIYAIMMKMLNFLKKEENNPTFTPLFADIENCKNMEHYWHLLQRVLVARNLPNINELLVAINALRLFKAKMSTQFNLLDRLHGRKILLWSDGLKGKENTNTNLVMKKSTPS